MLNACIRQRRSVLLVARPLQVGGGVFDAQHTPHTRLKKIISRPRTLTSTGGARPLARLKTIVSRLQCVRVLLHQPAVASPDRSRDSASSPAPDHCIFAVDQDLIDSLCKQTIYLCAGSAARLHEASVLAGLHKSTSVTACDETCRAQ
jgi:hypothetical protein